MLLGEPRTRVIVYEDTFARIAREEGVGYDALLRANPGVDPWLPEPGSNLVLPTAMLLPAATHEGVVINLSELRLYFFDPAGQRVFVYPIGIGSEGRETPLMQTKTVSKLERPTWYPPASVRARYASEGRPLAGVVPPGPDNPLGTFAIKLARSGYFIHGTNDPIGVGRRVSSGCIRMYERDIAALVAQLPNGTPVRVLRQPYKTGWRGDTLYLEAHPSTSSYTEAVRQVVRATETRAAQIDWDRVVEIARDGAGIPLAVTR